MLSNFWDDTQNEHVVHWPIATQFHSHEKEVMKKTKK